MLESLGSPSRVVVAPAAAFSLARTPLAPASRSTGAPGVRVGFRVGLGFRV